MTQNGLEELLRSAYSAAADPRREKSLYADTSGYERKIAEQKAKISPGYYARLVRRAVGAIFALAAAAAVFLLLYLYVTRGI